MDARDFLQVASDVLHYKTEACFRTSVSRSYYAAYHFFCNECECLGIHIPKSPTGHETLITNFFNSGIRTAADIGRTINDLRGQRIDADYVLNAETTERTAELVLQKADRVIRSFNLIVKDDLKSGILTYQARIAATRSSSGK